VAAGVGLFLTGKILGHLRTSTTERYAHLAESCTAGQRHDRTANPRGAELTDCRS
jgi:hypothetical protein